MQIPIMKPYFDQAEQQALLAPLQSGWLVQGPNVAAFEAAFAEFTGAKYAVAVTSCTSALHLALLAAGVGPGDKVIVPALTYVASANAVRYTGAEVLFCDIDLRTYNIDVHCLAQLITDNPDVKAIMPVHLFGLCANMKQIRQISNVAIIEDAACGFDAWLADKHAGTMGDSGCFSFHPRKSISTGEGGMIVTDNQEIATLVAQLRDHGASKSDLARHQQKGGSLLPEFNQLGYNYRMTDFQGALGVSQMKKADFIMHARRQLAQQYHEALSNNTQLITPYLPDCYKHGYQSFVCLFTDGESLDKLSLEQIDALNVKRNHFMLRLEEKGIATRQGTHAVHTLGYYKNRYQLNNADYLQAYAADRLSVTLPLYVTMTPNEFEYVIDNIQAELR